MKKIVLLAILIACTFHSSSQSTARSYKLKATYIQGNILKFTPRIEALVQNPVSGAELALEYQTVGERDWHYNLHFPVYGVALTYLNLGNPDILGTGIAVYPYMNFPLIRTQYASLYIKAGGGLSALTKYYSNTNTDNRATLSGNTAIGSMLNVYLTAGGVLDIPLYKGITLTGEYGWNHISNGSIIAPNEGLNMLNVQAGIKYTPNYNELEVPHGRDIRQMPHQFSTEIVLAGGIRQLYYKDNKNFAIGSLSASEFYNFNNAYRLGLGADIFYDGVYGAINTSSNPSEIRSQFKRTYITSDQLKNKIRAGISLQHELMIGRLTAGFHFGIYLYDPIKNLEPYDKVQNGSNQSKGLIYAYDIDKEDGWLYTRAIMKYQISGTIFASVALKTHQQKAEFIEWGIGYCFPKGKR